MVEDANSLLQPESEDRSTASRVTIGGRGGEETTRESGDDEEPSAHKGSSNAVLRGSSATLRVDGTCS